MSGTRARGTDPFDQTDLGDFMDSMVAEAKELWTVQKDYYALVASEKAARLSAGLVNSLVWCVVLAAVLVFLSLACAVWLGEMMDSLPLGFLVMGGAFLLVGIVFMLVWRGGLRDKFILRWINALYHD